MKVKDFEELVDRYGEDVSRWPLSLRAPARELLANSDEARKILQSAQRVRTLLKNSSFIRAPAGLADRIVARAAAADLEIAETAPEPLPPSFWKSWAGRPLRPALMLSCLVFGVVAGLMTAPTPDAGINSEPQSILADVVQ